MNTPAVGSTIRVEVKNFSPTRLNPMFNEPETKTYEGTVIPNDKWQDPDTFKMTSSDPYVPSRVVYMKNVVSLDGSVVVHNVQTTVRVEQVVGSKGNVYNVVIDGDRVSCSCPQNQFRKQICKHIKQVMGIVDETTKNNDSDHDRVAPTNEGKT